VTTQDAASLEGPGGNRFVFDPSLFPPGRYKITVFFDRGHDGTTYLLLYEVRSREWWGTRFWNACWRAIGGD
jgi:hypothetical protein